MLAPVIACVCAVWHCSTRPPVTPVATSTKVPFVSGARLSRTLSLSQCTLLSRDHTYGAVRAGGMDSANPVHMAVVPTATVVSVSDDQCQVVLSLAFPAETISDYGAAATVISNFTVSQSAAPGQSQVQLAAVLSWTNKTVTRYGSHNRHCAVFPVLVSIPDCPYFPICVQSGRGIVDDVQPKRHKRVPVEH